MGTISRQSNNSLDDAIYKHHSKFNYYQLVRLLQQQSKAIRYRADLSSAFPRHEISEIDKGKYQGEDVTTLKSPNFCIAGVIGPLSEPYLEWMRERSRDGDRTMSDFLDLFNNRLHVLRNDLKSHRFAGLNSGTPENSVQGRFLEALIGLWGNKAIYPVVGSKTLHKRKLLAISGLLVNVRRSAPLIERILTCLLDVPVSITQMVGAWCDKAEQDISYLGQKNYSLGKTASLGKQVWEQQARIRINIGPVRFSMYNELLPGGGAYEELASILRYITNRIADYEIVLQAEKGDIPKTVPDETPLSEAIEYPGLQNNDSTWQVRIGQTAWLKEKDDGDMPREAIFVIPAFEVAA